MRGLSFALLGLVTGAFAQQIQLRPIASGIPGLTDIQAANDASGRLFFVQQNGVIRVYRSGALLPQPFLDITSKTRASGEQGLLGLAFPPGFARSQRFYVNYTDTAGNTVVALYRVTADPNVADPASEVVLLRIDQPYVNHNGGQIRFGPDGYLYVGMGDGGSAGDPLGKGQNPAVLLGKMLRLDVEREPGRVLIPGDNPWAATPGTRPEIWALGLRNPWRFSFDRETRDLWIADVGQGRYEEINLQPGSSRGGENYGWNVAEGAHCYSGSCSLQGFTLPVAEYTHSDGCSVTGGFVYRGQVSPTLRGTYLYSDYCSGLIWGLQRQSGNWVSTLLLNSGYAVTTFGEDDAGELYLANAANGTIYRVEGPSVSGVAVQSVTNAASFVPGLTAGSLATVFATGVMDSPGVVTSPGVPLSGALAGVTVTVNGIAAPIHSVANQNGQQQVNFQAPYEIRGSTVARVAVARSSQTSVAVEAPVWDLQPAVYSSAGGNVVIVRSSDYTLVTQQRPLAAGEYVFLYASGLGRAAPEPATGAAAPLGVLAYVAGDVRVTLNGSPCEVQFAGLAPLLVGVYQVNFRVPPQMAGGTADLIVTVNGVASPPVKVALQ